MKHLLTAIRIYWLIILAAVLTHWIPGIPAVIVNALHLATWPVWNLFNWAIIGSFHLGPVVAMLVLWGLEVVLTKYIDKTQHTYHPSAPAKDGERDEE